MTLEIANARLSASHAIERLWAPAHRRTFGSSAQKRGIRDVVLLAMGGGSFGPECCARHLGHPRGSPAPSRRPRQPATYRLRSPSHLARRLGVQPCAAPGAGAPARSRMLAVPDIRIHRDSQTWAEAAAEFVLEVGNEALRANGRFFIALSGGTTPETLYRVLTSPTFADRFDWSRTTFFFSDERCVPPEDPRSNYGLAKKTLFTPLRITPSHVYRMAGESQ